MTRDAIKAARKGRFTDLPPQRVKGERANYRPNSRRIGLLLPPPQEPHPLDEPQPDEPQLDRDDPHPLLRAACCTGMPFVVREEVADRLAASTETGVGAALATSVLGTEMAACLTGAEDTLHRPFWQPTVCVFVTGVVRTAEV